MNFTFRCHRQRDQLKVRISGSDVLVLADD
jgi:hypothetical protein